MRTRARFILAAFAVFTSGACASGSDKRASAESWSPALVDSLMRLGREDQDGREKIAQAFVANDTAAILRMMRADSAHSQWLRAEVVKRGWPTRTIVGDSAAGAAWLILQHSPLTEWQAEMLPKLEQLAGRGEMKPSEVAMLTDRVLGRRGEPQRYGSEFKTIDGKLVPAPIADLPGLDARRAAVGLPPMAEYARVLGEVYKLPVVWPPPR